MAVVVGGDGDEFVQFTERGSAPATPSTGKWRMYTTANGLAVVDDAGNVTPLYPAYGNIYVKDGSTAQGSITTTPGKLTGFAANGLGVLITPDHTDDSLTVVEAGDYKLDFSCSYSGTANTTFTFFLRIDAAEDNYGSTRKLGTGGDVGDISFHADVTLAASDVLTVYVECDSGTTSITVVQANLSAVRH